MMVHRTGTSAKAPIGHPAVTADALWELTDLALHCEYADLQRELEVITSQVHGPEAPPSPLTETEKLLDEALWYLRAGEIDEAIYRLEQAEDSYDEPIDDRYDAEDAA